MYFKPAYLFVLALVVCLYTFFFLFKSNVSFILKNWRRYFILQ